MHYGQRYINGQKYCINDAVVWRNWLHIILMPRDYIFMMVREVLCWIVNIIENLLSHLVIYIYTVMTYDTKI